MTSIAQAIRTIVLCATCVLMIAQGAAAQHLGAPADPQWGVPDVGALPNDANGQLVRRGRDLITATYAHIGPAVADPAKRYAGNNLACSNCHLLAGTKKFGLPLWGLWDQFPQYSDAFRRRNLDRGSRQFLHDAQHERQTASGGCTGNDGDRVLHQIPLDRREAGPDFVRPRCRENARTHARGRSRAWRENLRAIMRDMPRARWARRAAQSLGAGSGLLESAALGAGQF